MRAFFYWMLLIPFLVISQNNNEYAVFEYGMMTANPKYVIEFEAGVANHNNKYHTDGISSSEFGERSKLEIENALKNSDAPITQFMFGEPKASYYQNCKNSQDKIYTTPKHFYELYGNNYEVEIFFRGLDKRNLPEYHIEISGKTTNLKEQKCSFKLPSLYVVIENEKVYLVSLIYIYRKGLPGVQ